MRISSVAIIVSRFFAHAGNVPKHGEAKVCPAISYSGFPGNRLEPQRAGMITTGFTHTESCNGGVERVPRGVVERSNCEDPSARARDDRFTITRRKLRPNNLGCFREILRDPIGRTVGSIRFKTGADTDGFDSRVVPAMHINFFVTNENRPCEINIVFFRTLQNHARCRLPAFRVHAGRIGTEVELHRSMAPRLIAGALRREQRCIVRA